MEGWQEAERTSRLGLLVLNGRRRFLQRFGTKGKCRFEERLEGKCLGETRSQGVWWLQGLSDFALTTALHSLRETWLTGFTQGL